MSSSGSSDNEEFSLFAALRESWRVIPKGLRWFICAYIVGLGVGVSTAIYVASHFIIKHW